MQRLFLNLLKLAAAAAALLMVTATATNLSAQTTSNWIDLDDGQWDSAANWSNGVPDGTIATANFNTLDIVEQPTFFRVGVQMQTSHTVNQLVFGDTNAATPGAWEMYFVAPDAPVLTLGGTTPSVTVNPLGPIAQAPPTAPIDDAIIRMPVAGTAGFTKLGNGTLALAGANTITGPVNISAGKLRFVTAAANTGLLPAVPVTIGNGATLSVGATLDAVGTRIFSVASGNTATIEVLSSVEVGRFDVAGANINVVFPSTAPANTRFTPSGNWLATAATANPASFNVTGQGAAPVPGATPTGSVIRLAPNLSTTTIRNFNGATFANTPVTLNNTLLYSRTNSGGNTFNFGSLSGDATAILSGGNQGSFANYSIGALNTDTTFAGTIDSASSGFAETTPADTGGLNLTKVGTGTLTLSGTLSYQPTGNTTVNRRGAITTITGGTLKLTNSAAIPGGIVHATAGNVLSTVNIQTGATLDVSVHTGTYATAALQQVIGIGTVKGNYIHGQGFIRPGNTITGTTPTANPVAGTLNFANSFTWSGGEYTYDITTAPATSDLIAVTGATTLTSGSMTPNFISPVTIGGTYTLLTSAGGISGTASNITINWPGRGPDPVPFINGNSLQFVALDPNTGANLVWRGNNGTNPTFWDLATANWQNGANPADLFVNSDNVKFDNTNTGSLTVDIQTVVAPASITVDNDVAHAYTIGGVNGTIGGTNTTTFTKKGVGTLTINPGNASTFSGAASIDGGTVDLQAQTAALGTGPLTMSNNTKLTTNSTVNGAAITNSALIMAAGSTNFLEINGTFNSSTVIPSLQGSGNIDLTTTVAPDVATGNTKIITLGNTNTAFTGNLAAGATGQPVLIRTNGDNAGLPNSVVTLGPGATLRDFNNGAANGLNIQLGALVGAAGSFLGGNTGGSGAVPKTWVIGGLNTSTEFAGSITNGSGNNSTRAVTNITKAGTGTLTLSGNNIHGGVTTVNAGTLLVNGTHTRDLDAIQPATPFTVGDYVVNTGGTLGGTGNIGDNTDADPVLITVNSGGKLAPGASVGTLTITDGDVSIGAGGIFDFELNSAGQGDQLVLTGIAAQSGNITLDPTSVFRLTAIGTPPVGNYTIATYTGALTGTFGDTGGYALNYSTPGQIILNFNGIPGDFNHSGQVNGADLTIWKGAFGTTNAADADNDGDSDGADFLTWQRNFGAGGSATPTAGPVPEPATVGLSLAGLIGLTAIHRRRAAR